MDFHIYHHFDGPCSKSDEILAALGEIKAALHSISHKEDTIMATLADVVTAEAAEHADIVTLLADVDTLMATIASGSTDQATIDALMASINAGKDAIEAKLAVITPPAAPAP